METLLAFVIGGLVAVSIYLLMRRDLVRKVIGIVILSNAVNLLIFTLGRVTQGASPLIPSTAKVPPEGIANPLSQALILTAIVIGFGMLSFALVLLYRTQQTTGTVDADAFVDEGPDPST
jgi:multicomponent Na+:H+ antiporter subunit C